MWPEQVSSLWPTWSEEQGGKLNQLFGYWRGDWNQDEVGLHLQKPGVLHHMYKGRKGVPNPQNISERWRSSWRLDLGDTEGPSPRSARRIQWPQKESRPRNHPFGNDHRNDMTRKVRELCSSESSTLRTREFNSENEATCNLDFFIAVCFVLEISLKYHILTTRLLIYIKTHLDVHLLVSSVKDWS